MNKEFMNKEIPKKIKFTVEYLQIIKVTGFGFIWTYDYESGIDLLVDARSFIEKEVGITIPHHIRIGRKDIKHIFDHHGYDTELGCGTSIVNEDIVKIQEIVYLYDEIKNTSFQDNITKENHYRFTFKKLYGVNTYTLVLEILQNNKRQPNQLGLITLYINDVVTEPVYFAMRNSNKIGKARIFAKKQYGDRY